MKRSRTDPTRWYPALGAIAVLIVAAVVYVAFNANRTLPFSSNHRVTVELPDAARLAPTNDVRIAGVRVGQVDSVEAVTGAAGFAPYARVHLKLNTTVAPLAVDSTAKVRPASILGTNYLDLTPGRSTTMVPWGGVLARSQARPTVELTDLLDLFDRGTAHSVQSAITSVGGGLAGRGAATNQILASLADVMPSLQRVAATVSSPQARLPRFIRGFDTFMGAIAPVSDRLAQLFDGGATTFAALAAERQPLGRAIDLAPAAETAATTALSRLRPALVDLAGLAGDLEDPVDRLPRALQRANGALRSSVTPLRRLPGVTRRLDATLAALGRLSRHPATNGALRKLTDLVRAAGPTLETLVPAQVQCNVISLFAQSFGTAYGTVGFGEGPPMAFIGEKHLGSIGESLQNPSPSSGIAINGNPHENYQECESGNEVYPYSALPVFNGPGKPLIGNPPGLQSNHTLDTYPPDGVHDLARGAGLLPLRSETEVGR